MQTRVTGNLVGCDSSTRKSGEKGAFDLGGKTDPGGGVLIFSSGWD